MVDVCSMLRIERGPGEHGRALVVHPAGGRRRPRDAPAWPRTAASAGGSPPAASCVALDERQHASPCPESVVGGALEVAVVVRDDDDVLRRRCPGLWPTPSPTPDPLSVFTSRSSRTFGGAPGFRRGRRDPRDGPHPPDRSENAGTVVGSRMSARQVTGQPEHAPAWLRRPRACARSRRAEPLRPNDRGLRARAC